jgi:hypothetical protein
MTAIIVVVVCLLVLLLVAGIVRCSCEQFTQEKKKLPLDKAWKKRLADLRKIVPIFYRGYFSPIKPVPRVRPQMRKNKIFISVASYRDEQCLTTIKNIAENADHPENLVIVVCQQNSVIDKDCLGWCTSDKTHPTCPATKIERLSFVSARGPTWARWRIQQRWDGEEYYLQVDAHTRMVKGWDTILKDQLSRCPSDKPVLTQYPLEYDIVNGKGRGDPVREKWQTDKLRSGLYVQKFDDPDGFYRIQSEYTEERKSTPFPATCWAAGFSFSRGEFFWEVGYDPYTPFLFFGEEMDIAARGWTWGWDFFSPSETVIFHNYKREHRSTFWENPLQWPLEILSRFRIYVRLGYLKPSQIPKKYQFILHDIDAYPLGTVRTLKEYQRMANFDISTETKK